MKSKVLLIVVILVIAGVAVAAWFFFKSPQCPTCQQASAWSSCNAEGNKTRTAYSCSKDTDNQCQSKIEQGACAKEIDLVGANGLEAVVSPSIETMVRGIITVTVNGFPAGADKIWVMMTPQGWQSSGSDPFSDPNIIIEMVDAKEGQVISLDTKKVENTVYTLGVMATNNPGGAPWLDVAQSQVTVENFSQ